MRWGLRLRSPKNVNAGAAYFRVNFFHLGGSNAGIVTGEMEERHRKDAESELIDCQIPAILLPLDAQGLEEDVLTVWKHNLDYGKGLLTLRQVCWVDGLFQISAFLTDGTVDQAPMLWPPHRPP